jgi:hypothetical protein
MKKTVEIKFSDGAIIRMPGNWEDDLKTFEKYDKKNKIMGVRKDKLLET